MHTTLLKVNDLRTRTQKFSAIKAIISHSTILGSLQALKQVFMKSEARERNVE